MPIALAGKVTFFSGELGGSDGRPTHRRQNQNPQRRLRPL